MNAKVTFAASYDFWQNIAGKGVLNILGGVITKWYLPFNSYDSVAPTLGCKLVSFDHFLKMLVRIC